MKATREEKYRASDNAAINAALSRIGTALVTDSLEGVTRAELPMAPAYELFIRPDGRIGVFQVITRSTTPVVIAEIKTADAEEGVEGGVEGGVKVTVLVTYE